MIEWPEEDLTIPCWDWKLQIHSALKDKKLLQEVSLLPIEGQRKMKIYTFYNC